MNADTVVDNLLETDVDDPNAFLRHYGGKPYGYILRSPNSMYPWCNPGRLGNAPGQCGSFFKQIAYAKVFKKLSTAKGYSELEPVPVYSHPKRTGLKALDPNYSEQCVRCDRRVNGDLRVHRHPVCGKCLFQFYRQP